MKQSAAHASPETLFDIYQKSFQWVARKLQFATTFVPTQNQPSKTTASNYKTILKSFTKGTSFQRGSDNVVSPR